MSGKPWIIIDPDQMTWPNPDDPEGVQWALRYGDDEHLRSVRMIAASYVAAYQHLISLTNEVRNERANAIKAALKGGPDA